MTCSEITNGEKITLTYVSFASASLSLLGSGITMIAFCLQRKHLRKQQFFQLIFFLSLADFVGSLGLVVSQDQLTYDLCVAFRAIVQFSFTSSFLWYLVPFLSFGRTTCIAYHIYRAVNHMSSLKWMYAGFHVLCWGLPALLVVVTNVTGNIERVAGAGWCHATAAFEWVFWFTPMLLCILLNLFFYFLISRGYNRRTSSKRAELGVLRTLSLFLLAFVFCWMWDIIVHVRLLFTGKAFDHLGLRREDCPSFVLWLLQDTFTPLQGFLNFFVYGFSSRMLQIKNPFGKGEDSERLLRVSEESTINY